MQHRDLTVFHNVRAELLGLHHLRYLSISPGHSTLSIFFKFRLARPWEAVYIIFLQADMAQLVEHNLAKVGVAGSSPVVRSIACERPDELCIRPFSSATWPSGKAEACKAFTPSSNLGVASMICQGAFGRLFSFGQHVGD